MNETEWGKLDHRVQKNLLDAHHQTVLNTYDDKIREALKLGVQRAIADNRPQTDIAVIVIAKDDGVIAGLPESVRSTITNDYNIIWGYRDELAGMAPWGTDKKHAYYEMMEKIGEEEPVTEPGEISVWAAVFAFDVATVRRLHFTPKKIELKPAT